MATMCGLVGAKRCQVLAKVRSRSLTLGEMLLSRLTADAASVFPTEYACANEAAESKA